MAPRTLRTSRSVTAQIVYDDGQVYVRRAVEEIRPTPFAAEGQLPRGAEEVWITTHEPVPFELLGVTATVTVGGLDRRMLATDCLRFVLSPS